MRKLLIFTIIIFIISCTNMNDKRSDKMNFNNKEEIIELYEKADSLYRESNYELAAIYFTKVLEKDSVNADAYFKRAYSYAQTLKYNDSTKDYLKAIELNYRKSDALFNLGCNLSAQTNFEQALLYFQRALELEPHNREIKAHVQICLKNLNNKEI